MFVARNVNTEQQQRNKYNLLPIILDDFERLHWKICQWLEKWDANRNCYINLL